jgi:hypothetical protein
MVDRSILANHAGTSPALRMSDLIKPSLSQFDEEHNYEQFSGSPAH